MRTMLCCTPWTLSSTRLFSHAVTALFNHQINLLTKLSINDNNSEQAYSINIVFSCSNNREQPFVASSMLNNVVETIQKSFVCSTTLFSHDNRLVTAYTSLQRHYTRRETPLLTAFWLQSWASGNNMAFFRTLLRCPIKVIPMVRKSSSFKSESWDGFWYPAARNTGK